MNICTYNSAGPQKSRRKAVLGDRVGKSIGMIVTWGYTFDLCYYIDSLSVGTVHYDSTMGASSLPVPSSFPFFFF